MNIDKEGLEKYLGYEIQEYKIYDLLDSNDKLLGINIYIKPKLEIENIIINFKINE